MATRKISTLVAIDGESDYKQSIANINNSLKTLKSEMALVESAYQDNANSTEALTAKKEVLLKRQTEETEKVQTLQKAVENAKAAQEKHAATYDQMTTKIQTAQASLEALKEETGDTSDQQKALTDEIEKYRTEQENAQKSQESATRGMESWQQQLNYAQRDLNNTNAAIEEVEAALNNLDFEQVTEDVQETTVELGKFNATLEDVQGGLSQASDNLGKMGTALTVGLTAPIIAAGTAAVSYASDTEESLNKVDVAFGNSADAVVTWSNTTLTSIGLAKGTALDMAALYGDMATAMGYGQEEAAEMSMELVNLGADLASFKNISIDEASTALKSIFTGETESLKDLGVVMTETNLIAYALANGFTTAYSEMDQAEKVALRYAYVLDATENAQGDFSRTADGTANQLRILQESLKEAAASLGEELLPIVTPIIEKLAELAQVFADLDEETQKNVVRWGIFLATLGPTLLVTSALTKAVNLGITAYLTYTATTTAATAAQTGLNVAMAANPIGLVVTAVGVLISILASLAISTALTAEETDTLTASLQASRAAYEETVSAVEEQGDSVQNMVSALTALEAVENKSTAQKQAMLTLVEQLNEAEEELADQTEVLTETIQSYSERIEGATQMAEKNASATEALTSATTTLNSSLDSLSASASNQAEEDLNTYKILLSELDHRHGDGVIFLKTHHNSQSLAYRLPWRWPNRRRCPVVFGQWPLVLP